LESRYLKEYNNRGELVFIVDKKTAKGFHVRNSIGDVNIEEIISKKINNNSDDKDISCSCINRITAFRKIANTTQVSKLLLALYCTFFLLLALMIIFGKFSLSIHSISNVSEFDIVNSLKGLFLFVIGVFFIHEFSHVLVARSQDIFIKKIGFRLRYLVFPIFFVRVFPTSNREKKMNIAFVGLVSDLFLLLFYNISFLITNQSIFQYALSFQLLMTLFNYNILLPTDFTNSVLLYFNFGNFRNEAFEYSKSFLKRNQTIYKQASKVRRFIYILYTVLFTVLWFSVLLNIISQFIQTMKMR
jgi:hypothetical protein